MPQRKPALWASVLVVIAIVAAGCGGEQSTKETKDAFKSRDKTYESVVSEIHVEMNTAMAAAFASRDLDAQLVRAARTTATDSLKQLNATAPPTEYRAAHAEYTAGLDTFAGILADVERQVDEPEVARRHLGDKRFMTGVARLERATTLYDKAGLDLDAGADAG